jgi:peptidoglycan/LPS O-acetylase OafA/YrhL
MTKSTPFSQGLEGLKGLAILFILLHHFTWPEPPAAPGRKPLLLSHIYYRVLGAGGEGWIGINVLFVVSGFLLTRALLNAKGAPDYYRNFYMRRVLRLLPLYYGILIFVFVIAPFIRFLNKPPSAAYTPAWLWLFGTDFQLASVFAHSGAIHHFADWLWLDHLWPLAVGVHFFLIWPVVVKYCTARRLMLVCGAIFLIALILRLFLAVRSYPTWSWAAFLVTPCQIDAIAVGAFAAAAIRERGNVSAFVAQSRLVGGFAGIVVLGFLAEKCYGIKIDPQGTAALANDVTVQGKVSLLWMSSSMFSVVNLFSGALLVLIVFTPRSRITRYVWNSLPLRFLGKYSYGIYLFHYLLLPLYEKILPRERMIFVLGSYPFASMVFTFMATALTVQLAWISWHLFERHFLKLNGFFGTAHPAAQRPTAATAKTSSDLVAATARVVPM